MVPEKNYFEIFLEHNQILTFYLSQVDIKCETHFISRPKFLKTNLVSYFDKHRRFKIK